ncbi:Hypothetical protein, putative [Bodo saltans]|uniref:Uncharacterized protein n=1 Tax=Bodo saltans TaxID=75058 RepID=A0A0S4JKP6_BODSA|nr:Hypothetical protein, putative [Bodo saltans]|eukprot:CUG90748.1 Hypothetical protein, putative [Bodo saltans]
MSVISVFAKGRGHAHEKVTNVGRYIPRARTPFQPSTFGRKNLTKEDLAQVWGRGRYRTGYANANSGYSTEKSKVMDDNTVTMIPKHELEKYMPDISLGPKSLVTPISLMSARNGHRVTHDMIHSYDAHIGALEKPAVVDHNNIIAQDNINFVGLNAATLDCRGRIYRWLRRGPFFQEDQYFRRYVAPGGLEKAPTQEVSLFKRVVRLAGKGRLKGACEEYRKITTVPPVEVYRALTAACIPHGNLGDAISVFEDGNAKLFYVARDGEVLHNLMSTAVTAKNRPRVMWVFNVMRGRYHENKFIRAEIDPLWQYRITVRGLTWLLDNGCAEEARVLYAFLEENKMLDNDLQVRLGQQMKDALAAGKPISLTAQGLSDLAVMKAVRALAANLRSAVQESQESFETALHESNSGRDDGALEWLQQKFGDVDVLAVMRLARYRGRRDLFAKPEDQELFFTRCTEWLYLLSERQAQSEGKPLTYMRKSKPSAVNENVRIAWVPELQKKTRLLPSEMGMGFSYKNGTRFVHETFPAAGATLASKFLALQPIQTEVTAAVDFSRLSGSIVSPPVSRLIHPSAGGASETRTLAVATAAVTAPATEGDNEVNSLADKNAVSMEPTFE